MPHITIMLNSNIYIYNTSVWAKTYYQMENHIILSCCKQNNKQEKKTSQKPQGMTEN
jgi:hypothetical protein